jgi:2-furoyl-CoA dehydrogenase large subunit
VPRVRVRRSVPAPPSTVWALVGDPHSLARWWPRAARVEDVSGGGFTLVLTSSRGREVRADQRMLAVERGRRCAWALQTEGSPFANVFESSETEVRLSPAGDGATEVELELRQRLKGAARLGGVLVRRAGRRELRSALDGLEHNLSAGPDQAGRPD